MSDLRSATNWCGILDSSHALRKILHPKQLVKAARNSVTTKAHGEWSLNSDWKLARDPSHPTKASATKSTISLPKKVERIIWAKPSMVELTKAVVRTERAKASAIKFHEKLQAKKTQPEKTEQPEKKTPSLVRRTRKSKDILRWNNRRPSNILVVDAQKESRISRPNTGGAEKPMDSIAGQAQRRSKKSYSVPLCTRPTKILGMGYPYSRHMQMRQQQLCQQPEYRDQHVRMLHCQQRQLEQYYGQPYAGFGVPDKNQQQILYMDQHQKKYAVPAKSPLKGLKKGKRLCGNFYFD
ncbi:hypothetical protein KR032_003659 [Drosophila birchii]|nr:hypothetical protein KR032_003659 [Drosophila birchii]